MTHAVGPTPSAPPLSEATRELLRWLSCNNPFYVLSAGLFLIGLWASFQAGSGEIETWTLMGSLAGYTLLLAVTAVLLVRYAQAWDDLRTVLLVVVVMFLATSVTFDEVLILSPGRGFACYLLALFFTILVSEGILRGIRLRLPAWFRMPYYLILALFFLYPLALSPWVEEPHSEGLLWGLFAFSSLAGLVFLTLLPAIHRGPGYVENNGSPWTWPLYPWVLFGTLGMAVPARAFLLCWSMQLLNGGDRTRLIFGPYFLVPFGLAVAILLLEIGLVSGRRSVVAIALAAPLGLVVLALVGHQNDPIYREFRNLFVARLGGQPLYLTLVAAAVFYVYAALRRVPLALEALTVVLAALSFVVPSTEDLRSLGPLEPAPLLAAVALQLILACWRLSAWRWLFAIEGLVAALAMVIPDDWLASPMRQVVFFHLVLFALLAVGAFFNNDAGLLMRVAGTALALFACTGVLFSARERFGDLPPWAPLFYPLVMAVVLALYGWLISHGFALGVAALIAVIWLARAGWGTYIALRQIVAGLDQIALSMALFAVAVLISLGKSGVLTRWRAAWRSNAGQLNARTPDSP
jgi:hypothetical protein